MSRRILVKAFHILLFLAMTAFLSGCDKNIEEYVRDLGGKKSEETEKVEETVPTTTTTTMTLPECNAMITNGFGGGAGTVANPYRICSSSQWLAWAASGSNLDKAIKLTDDLDFTGVNLAGFTMLANGGTPFSGTIDGNGKAIKNLTLTGISSDFALIKSADGAVKISNLTLKDITLTSTAANLGVLVLDHGPTSAASISFENITVQNISLTPNLSSNRYLGVLVGLANKGLIVQNYTATGITIEPVDGQGLGGIAGRVYGSISVDDVTMTNFIVDESISAATGVSPLIGYAVTNTNIVYSDINVVNAYVWTGDWYTGGLLASGEFSNCNSFTVSNVSVTGTFVNSYSASVTPFLDCPSGTISASNVRFMGTLSNGGNGQNGGIFGYVSGTTITMDRGLAVGNHSVWSGKMGGLIGHINATTATITDSMAVGTITGTHANSGIIGGLVGHLGQGDLTITRSYYSGSLSFIGTSIQKGCAVGYMTPPAAGLSVAAVDSYYNSTVCSAGGVNNGTAIAGYTATAQAGFETGTPFTNWLTSVWDFTVGQLPFLK